MGQLPFQLPAHRLVGFAIESRTRRPVAQRLVQPLLVIKPQPPADASARLRNRAIGFDEGEWRACALPSTRRSCRRPIEKDPTKAEQQLPLSWRRWLPSNEVAILRRVQLRTCPGYARFASGAAWPGISASVAQKFPVPPEARCS